MTPEQVTAFQGNLEDFHRGYGKFIKRCSRLKPPQTDEVAVCGMWSAREVVAHLAGWLHEAARALNAWLKDGSPMPDYDIDAFNAASVADRADWDWDHVLADLRAGQLAVQHALERLMIQNPPDYSMFTTWLGILADEFEHHQAQMDGVTPP